MAVQVDRHGDERRGPASAAPAGVGVPPAAGGGGVGVDHEGVVAGAWGRRK